MSGLKPRPPTSPIRSHNFQIWTTLVDFTILRHACEAAIMKISDQTLMQIFPITRRKTVGVKVGHIQVGGGAPVVVQSMTNTDTADIAGTVAQCKELADAGSELVRITVNMPESAAAVAEIVVRLRDAGCVAPIIGDFHYNGHVLLTKYPNC